MHEAPKFQEETTVSRRRKINSEQRYTIYNTKIKQIAKATKMLKTNSFVRQEHRIHENRFSFFFKIDVMSFLLVFSFKVKETSMI